jgi:hypothetical protein
MGAANPAGPVGGRTTLLKVAFLQVVVKPEAQ